jgi:hypothetical protein
MIPEHRAECYATDRLSRLCPHQWPNLVEEGAGAIERDHDLQALLSARAGTELKATLKRAALDARIRQ